nr:unnamed protein product [Mus musculus]
MSGVVVKPLWLLIKWISQFNKLSHCLPRKAVLLFLASCKRYMKVPVLPHPYSSRPYCRVLKTLYGLLTLCEFSFVRCLNIFIVLLALPFLSSSINSIPSFAKVRHSSSVELSGQ